MMEFFELGKVCLERMPYLEVLVVGGRRGAALMLAVVRVLGS